MKANFILKGDNNPTNIVCRFKPAQEYDFMCSTGIWIDRKDWSNEKQRIKQKASIQSKDLINSKLSKLQNTINDKWTIASLNGETIPKDWLKNVINVFFGKAKPNEQYKIYFTDWAEKYITESPKRLYKGKPLTKQRITTYKTLHKALIEFEQHRKAKLKFQDIDLNFYRNFVSWCQTVKHYNTNTIGGRIKIIKMWCKNIELDGLPVNAQYKHSEFMSISTQTKDTYLTEAEINKVFEHDFSHSIRLEKARNLFIIGLRTGLRISDFMRLKEFNIKKEFIEVETLKTKEKVVIPLHHQVKAILNKNGGKLPPTISDQKFNDYIKEICKEVGITELIEGAKINPDTKRKETGIYPKYELISSHTCRRSFATNLYGQLPNLLIMDITGHNTEAVFLKYIKTTKQEHAEMLGKYWANQQKETGPKRILKVVS